MCLSAVSCEKLLHYPSGISCAVSRDGGTFAARPQPGVIISHKEGSLIRGNGQSGNFACVFSVVFSASLGDNDSRTDAEAIRACRRMFFSVTSSPPPFHDCTSKMSTECKSWVYCLTP